jgi:hypothetical protein
MDVHHHPQVEKKGFKAYFLEFLMIFLAVTLGFFAENLRERISDRSREKEYVTSLVEELQYDTAQYNSSLNKVKMLGPLLDSCYINVKQAARFNYTLFARWNTPVNEVGFRYNPTLPTIEQLKTSGNLRLLHNRYVIKKMLEYESFIHGDYLHHYNSVDEATNQVYRLEDQLCDYADFNAKLNQNMQRVDGQLNPEESAFYDMRIIIKDPQKLNALANSFVNCKANNYGYATGLNNALKTATDLLALINSVYHLKAEN